ncbi:MAG: IPT/TIG domain-containing protein [Candidatus Dormiibacterota bacterium]
MADPNQPPVITSYDVQGSASTAGGEVVAVTGSNLSVVNSVAVGPYPAGFVIDSDTQLRFTAPAYDPSIRSDPATAKVSAGNNSMMSETDQFPEWTWGGKTRAELQGPSPATPEQPQNPGDANRAPVVTGYDVQGSASTAGGEVVTVTGSNLSVVNSVAVGPYPAGFVIDSDTQLRFTAPAYDPSIRSDPATAKVSAGNNSMMSETDQFPEWTWGGKTRAELQGPDPATPEQPQTPGDANRPPVVTSYDVQGSASTAGGETVTVTGSNLSVVNSVAVGPYPAQFVIDSDTQLRFTAPAYDASIRSDPATAKVSAGNNSLMSETDQFPEWTWGGQTRAELQAAQTN